MAKPTKPKKARAIKPVSEESIPTALYAANVPSRYVRPTVTLTDFTWGPRLSKWLSHILIPKCLTAYNGRGCLVVGPSSASLDACAMLTRALVLRGHDAVLTTLPELIEGFRDMRSPEVLVIAGFYDHGLTKIYGNPMTAEQAHGVMWALWRMHGSGTIIIGYTDKPSEALTSQWPEGVLSSVFDSTNNLTLSRSI